MENKNYVVYAEFLAQCREVMGPFDFEKLAYDQNYKAEFFNKVTLSSNDKLFELAAFVNHQLDEDELDS